MIERLTRREVNGEAIENFLKSTNECLSLILYGGEIKKLPKEYPIVITKGENFRGQLYKCKITKK